MAISNNFAVKNGLSVNGIQVIDGSANGYFGVLRANDIVITGGEILGTDQYARDTANSAAIYANTGITLAQAAYDQANTGGGGGGSILKGYNVSVPGGQILKSTANTNLSEYLPDGLKVEYYANNITSSERWPSTDIIPSQGFSQVAFGDGIWVGVMSNINPLSNFVHTSTNGKDWIIRPLPIGPAAGSSQTLGGVAFNGTNFVTYHSGSYSYIYYSSNGINWNFVVPPSMGSGLDAGNSGGSFRTLFTVGTRFYICGSQSSLYSDDNGITWNDTSVGRIPTSRVSHVIWGNNEFLGVTGTGSAFSPTISGTIVKSPDGKKWTQYRAMQEINGSVMYKSVAWSGSVYCAVGFQMNSNNLLAPSQLISVSSDGVNWKHYRSPTNNGGYTSIIWNGSIFCAVGAGVSSTSSDGINWTHNFLPFNMGNLAGSSAAAERSNAHQLAWGNGLFVLAPAGRDSSVNFCFTSPDGLTWTMRELPSRETWGSVAWNGSIFLMTVVTLNAVSICATSPDGITWTTRNFPNSIGHCGNVFVCQNKFIILQNPAASGSRYIQTIDGINFHTESEDFIRNFPDPMFASTGASSPDGNLMVVLSDTALFSFFSNNKGNSWINIGNSISERYDMPPISSNSQSGGFASGFLSFANSGTRIVATGSNRNTLLYYSDDGDTWNVGPQQVSNTTAFVVGYGGGTINKFVILPSSFLGASTIAYHSDDGLNYTQITIPSAAVDTIAFGNNTLIATQLTSTASALYSNNGINWVTTTLPSEQTWRIGFGNNLFVATSGSTTAATSPDGITWTTRTLPSSAAWRAPVWNGFVFVTFVPNTTTAATSPDGITWTARTLPVNANWSRLVWDGKNFVLIANNNRIILTSVDGIGWVRKRLPNLFGNPVITTGTAAISYYGKIIIHCSTNKRTLTTTNSGKTWISDHFIALQNLGNNQISSYGNDNFGYLYGQSSTTYTARLLNEGQIETVDMTLQLGSINSSVEWAATTVQNAWNGRKHMVVPAYLSGWSPAFSDDGVDWYTPSFNQVSEVLDIQSNGSYYLATRTQGIAKSYDGINWTLANDPFPNFRKNALAWGANTWVATVQSSINEVIISSDGIDWRRVPAGLPAQNARALNWNGSQFIVISPTGGQFITSPDGITWSQAQSFPVFAAWRNVIWNGSQYLVFSGVSPNITSALTSPDGITWTSNPLPSGGPWSSVAWNGSVYCIVSGVNYFDGAPTTGYNTALTSPDGITWTARTLPILANWQKIIWNGSYFFALASNPRYMYNVVARSVDGINWDLQNLIDDRYPNSTPIGNINSQYGGTDPKTTYASITANTVSNQIVAMTGSTTESVRNFSTRSVDSAGTKWVNSTLNLRDKRTSNILNRANNTFVGTTSISCVNGIANNRFIGILHPTIPTGYGGSGNAFPGAQIIYSDDDGISWFQDIAPVFTGSNYTRIERESLNSNNYIVVNNSRSNILFNNSSEVANVKFYGSFGSVIPPNAVWNGSYWLAFANPPSVVDTSQLSSAVIWKSTDGISWNQIALPTMSLWRGLAWSGTTWVLVGFSQFGCRSTDGINWTLFDMPAPGSYTNIVWDSLLNRFYALNSRGFAATSSNGIDWNILVSNFNGQENQFQGLTHNGTRYVRLQGSSNPIVYYSDDGVVWSLSNTGLTAQGPTRIVSANGIFVATAAGGVLRSTDGIIWKNIQLGNNPGTGQNIPASQSVAWNGQMWMTIATNGFLNSTLYTSPDALVWTPRYIDWSKYSMPTGYLQYGIYGNTTDNTFLLMTSVNNVIIRPSEDFYDVPPMIDAGVANLINFN
jgi:hypothetical protein